jgi:hypothetical protein
MIIMNISFTYNLLRDKYSNHIGKNKDMTVSFLYKNQYLCTNESNALTICSSDLNTDISLHVSSADCSVSIGIKDMHVVVGKDSKLVLEKTTGAHFTLHMSKKSHNKISIKHGDQWVGVDSTGQVVLGPEREGDRYPPHFSIRYPCSICNANGETLPPNLLLDVTGTLHHHQLCGTCSQEVQKLAMCPVCKEAIRKVPTTHESMVGLAVASALECVPTSVENAVRTMDAKDAWKRISSKNEGSHHFPRYL